MIYYEYKVKFYLSLVNKKSPVIKYIEELPEKEQAKVLKYIDFLRESKGNLREPYSKTIQGKIRELRIDFANNRHRIFYFIFFGQNIILLHAFQKKVAKTPKKEIKIAQKRYFEVLNNPKVYE
ncbi:type II toxin-antitoxin system RelE/ParE family toxin [Candidatus Gribaldobacteria bacterium]|nr:type II toxin-antitoxin system RelE/ParE family toxin [Candidatus Gribaldobacteria bacterium]